MLFFVCGGGGGGRGRGSVDPHLCCQQPSDDHRPHLTVACCDVAHTATPCLEPSSQVLESPIVLLLLLGRAVLLVGGRCCWLSVCPPEKLVQLLSGSGGVRESDGTAAGQGSAARLARHHRHPRNSLLPPHHPVWDLQRAGQGLV